MTIGTLPQSERRDFSNIGYDKAMRHARECASAAVTGCGALREVELHWYEAHGIGKRDVKIKRYLG